MILLFVIIFYLGNLEANHSFYVSVMDIEYVRMDHSLNLEVKIFTDDLEDAIRAQSGKAIKLADGIEEEEATRVHNFLLTQIAVHVDKVAPDMHFTSCSLLGDAVFVGYTGELFQPPKEINVRSDLLYELFPTQVNIIRLKNAKGSGLLKLNKQNPSGKLTF